MQVELENLSLCTVQTASPKGRISRDLAAEIEKQQRIALVEGALPPGLAASRNHALKREVWDNAAIGAAPSFGVQGGQGWRIAPRRSPHLNDIGWHEASLARIGVALNCDSQANSHDIGIELPRGAGLSQIELGERPSLN
jgi:hypothetical protein